MVSEKRTTVVGEEGTAPVAKRMMRTVWSALPRTRWSYNLGKLITRTVLRPGSRAQPVLVRFGGRIPMTLDLGSFVANDLYCLDEHYESVTLRLWRTLARQARVILDIGSHIGTFALVAADANPQARVIAVEADGGNFARLRDHCVPYPNVTAVHAAIADRPCRMWFCPSGTNDGAGHLTAEQPADPRGYEVNTGTLAELCAAQQIGAVDLQRQRHQTDKIERPVDAKDVFLLEIKNLKQSLDGVLRAILLDFQPDCGPPLHLAQLGLDGMKKVL